MAPTWALSTTVEEWPSSSARDDVDPVDPPTKDVSRMQENNCHFQKNPIEQTIYVVRVYGNCKENNIVNECHICRRVVDD